MKVAPTKQSVVVVIDGSTYCHGNQVFLLPCSSSLLSCYHGNGRWCKCILSYDIVVFIPGHTGVFYNYHIGLAGLFVGIGEILGEYTSYL